ncbi:GNAT family N-acetyltransferase [Mesobacterium sp. TK19101]|uniref:GNAT family N-acetyltransferase n=1 Tax=Mesobacterium hydrothermale TaxID=3111907 RepID=A0ABU6HFJ3_9RHOB|nr:GNAT family N-acetyltransferase [Mesobacterium sp. TK19101]MEC3861086.1 GNAT family N-acetyltransferase [Mesobacterium sp. TK19101]
MTAPVPAPRDFSDWQGLLDLILLSFAYMERRIDPPSSAHRLTLDTLRQKARDEHLYLSGGASLTGCAFFAERPGTLYVGKMAIHPDRQRTGLGRAFMVEAEALARRLGLTRLHLETRIELTEVHEAYRRMGFVKTAEKAHPGFDRPTSITMERTLPPL